MSVKAQFEMNSIRVGGDSETLFTYTYKNVGVAACNGNGELPEQLQIESSGIEQYAFESLKELMDEANKNDYVMLEPEKRIKRVRNFDGGYVRHEYGYAVCYVEDQKEMKAMAELFVGDTFRFKGRESYEVVNKCAISDEIYVVEKDATVTTIIGIVFELKQITE